MSQRYLGGIITANPTTPTMTSESGVWTLEQQFQYTTTWSPKIVGNSVRLRSSASAYFNRTFGTPTNNKIWTWSAWVKKARPTSSYDALFSVSDSKTFRFGYTGSDYILNFIDTSTSWYFTTTQVFRDPSAWYHIVLVIDTTDATTGNRTKLYINGAQVTAFSAKNDPAQNTASSFNTSVAHYIGQAPTSGMYFDGYMAEINFVDGQALTPSSFGAYDSTGVWQPLPYTGTYGTNGFYLTFADNSAATAAALGKDYSGNGNNWTPNNISLTAGATYDWMLDSPTNFPNASTGIGNYAVLNPLGKFVSGGVTVSDGNLGTVLDRSTYDNWVPATILLPTTGKYYFEAQQTASTGSSLPAVAVGLMNSTTPSTTQTPTNYRAVYTGNGNKVSESVYVSYGTAYALNDIIQVAVDVDNGKIWFGKNNTWFASGDPVAGTNPAFTDIVSSGIAWYPALLNRFGNLTNTVNINFGQRPFSYTPPTGFKALNTLNLPDPNITNGAQYMAATTYTGTGSSYSVTNGGNNTIGVTFKPDFVWVKERSQIQDHALFDSVRGATKQLSSNTTGAEATYANSLSAFNSNGFTVVSDAVVNSSGQTYVSWQWQAGQGTTSSNTNGSITSTVSVNTTAGFSVVTFATTGSAGTVGHGLGVAPSLIIAKNRGTSTAWSVYHSSIGATYRLVLNTTDAAALDTSWNNTAPTSSVFSENLSGSVYNFVAYCWAAVAGYSAFGSYTGNGSADGPFVYLGFRPRFVLIKRTDAAGFSWSIWDSSRDTYNVVSNYLLPNSSAAEASASEYDFLSNGFKLRTTSTGENASGGTYIYAAFAENPFKISRAR